MSKANNSATVDEKRLQAMIPRDLHTRFKMAVYGEGKQINTVLIDLISEYLYHQEKATRR